MGRYSRLYIRFATALRQENGPASFGAVDLHHDFGACWREIGRRFQDQEIRADLGDGETLRADNQLHPHGRGVAY